MQKNYYFRIKLDFYLYKKKCVCVRLKAIVSFEVQFEELLKLKIKTRHDNHNSEIKH